MQAILQNVLRLICIYFYLKDLSISRCRTKGFFTIITWKVDCKYDMGERENAISGCN